MKPVKKEVLIIGGGFAGLSAGVELASRGHHVTLIERKGHLGGRAYSFRDPVTGSTMDNGQHILMGCYRETLAFLEKIGTRNRVKFQRSLAVDFAGPGGELSRFRALPLPAPLHLLGGFLGLKGIPLREKWPLIRFRRRFRNGGEGKDTESIPEWLEGMNQSPKMRERFWDLLALAALNDRPEISSAEIFSAVIREALFSGRKGSRIGIAMVGLSDLYTEAARDFIEKRGGQVLVRAPAVRLHFQGGEFQEVELEGGRRISAEVLLVTVPFTALRRILPDRLLYEDPFFGSLSQLKSSPIVAINLWFDREITASPFVGFWGTRIHWLFNKGRYLKEGPPYLSLVISGAREEMKIQGPELVDMALKELAGIYPLVAGARLNRSMVLKEPEATLSPVVGVQGLRPSQKTPYRNLFLAGDWTDTGLPATIESAVRSAKRAVELIETQG